MKYFGVFKKLKDLDMGNSCEYGIYESRFAEFYDKVFDLYDDLEIYKCHASITGSPILELGCGAGRITLQLAKAGFKITGIDMSDDMLKIMANKLISQSDTVKNNISYHKMDMTDFNLNKMFKLIILPATSISLIKDDEALDKLFRSVYIHLEADGKFIFDLRTVNNNKKHFFLSEMSAFTFTYDNDSVKEFVLLQEYCDLIKCKAVVNFYSEVQKDSETFRYFGYTYKNLISEETVKKAIQRNGYIISEEIIHEQNDNDSIKFFILTKVKKVE